MKFYIQQPSGHVIRREFDTLEELLVFINKGSADLNTFSVKVFPKEEWEIVHRIEIFNGHKEIEHTPLSAEKQPSYGMKL